MARTKVVKRAPKHRPRDKSAKFVELATSRVNRTLKELALVGNLANRSNYNYSDDQAKKIIRALQAGLDQVKSRFATGSALNQSNFEL
jgi:ABC-type Fe3+-hydroxamate transport system substrate-binding protein